MSERDVFIEAVQIASADERAAYLEAACGQDADLRGRVEALLAEHERDESFFLDAPAPDMVATANMAPLTEQPGTIIGPYKLLQQIGEGGMGVVYMAEQTEPVERRVALKIIKPGMDSRQVIARFEAERQALAMMDHPNIAKVLDAGTTDSGRPYFVMELVKGMPVTRYCDEQQLTPKERLELFVPICQAVQHAHQKGIIHRDLKPSNILVAEYDDQAVPKIIDFGVAKAVSQRLTEKTMFTQYGQIVGTVEYMSPEQAKLNQLDVDTRSDVYSLGVLLYELLTGNTPFDKQRLRSAAFDELLRIIREEEPPRPSVKLSTCDTLPSIAASRHVEPHKLSTLVRGELDWIVMKALEKDRSRRYETASSFAADVQHYLNDEAVVACPPSTTYRLRKFARRNSAAIGVATIVLCFLILLGTVSGWAIRDRRAREQEVAREREERQGKVTAQIDLIMNGVQQLERDQKWADAWAAAKRAEPIIATGDLPVELAAEVRRAITDLELVRQSEEIRLSLSELRQIADPDSDGHLSYSYDYEDTDRRYDDLFRHHGVDVDKLSTDESVALLRSRNDVVSAIVDALDHWAWCRHKLDDVSGVTHLVTIAQALDTDLLRRQVRVALQESDGERLVESLDLEDVARQSPATAELLARSLRDRGIPERALDVLNRALLQHPDDYWLHVQTALAHHECRPRHDAEAVAHFRVALALRPQDIAMHNDLGCFLRAQGKLEDARAILSRAIELSPSYPHPHNNLGNVLKDQGKLDQAISCYRKAIELDPDAGGYHYNLGFALKERGMIDEAITSYRRAIELKQKSAGAYSGLGSSLKRQGNLDEAIACFQRAVELRPENGGYHYNLGNALSSQGNLDEANACYRKAIELNYVDAYHNLGNALLKQKELEEAADNYRKAIELTPGNANSHYGLGVALNRQGKIDEAIDCYRTAIELKPEMSGAYDALGTVLRDQGELDEAIACYRKAVELKPKNASYHINLGLALINGGQTQRGDPVLAQGNGAQSRARRTLQQSCLALGNGQRRDASQLGRCRRVRPNGHRALIPTTPTTGTTWAWRCIAPAIGQRPSKR